MRSILLALLLLFSVTCLAKKNEPVPGSVVIPGPTVTFDTEVTGPSIERLLTKLRSIHDLLPILVPITIKLTSPGGSVFAGFTFIHELSAMQEEGRVFIGLVDRTCASMCFAMLQVMDVRQSYRFGLIMQHKSSVGGGTNIVTRTLDKQLETMEAKRIGLPLTIWEYVTQANIWVSPEQALDWNIIDEIVLPKRD